MPQSMVKCKSQRLSFFERHQLRNLCDGTVWTDEGKSLPVHRILMAVASPFFRAAFVPEGSNVESSTCKVQGIKSDILQQIIDYVIDGEIGLTDKNIQDLTLAADFFQMKELLKGCCDYIRFHISTDNCFAIYSTMIRLDHLDLTSYCYRFILINFEKLVSEENDSFPMLPSYVLESFLQSDDLNILGEETVWKGIYLWINRDLSRRQGALRLINYLRMNQRELSNTCDSFSDEISKNKFEIKPYGSQYLKRPIPAEKCHIVFESSPNQCTCRITYDDIIDFWRYVTEIPVSPDVIASDSSGHAYLLKEDRCWSLDLAYNRIQSLPNLRLHRRHYGVAVVDGMLYIIGGVLNDETLTKLTIVERYNPITREWSWVQTTQFPCKGPVAVLRGKIYAFGERCNLLEHEPMISFERYDPAFNSWALMSPMPYKKDVISVWTTYDCIFVASSRKNEIVMNVYNPDLNSWKTSSAAFSQIVNPKICKVRDTPILYEGNDTVKDPKAFAWTRSLEEWTETSDPFLRKLRHYQIFCVDDSESLENLKNRSHYEWDSVTH